MEFVRLLERFFAWLRRSLFRPEKISLLVPFRPDFARRSEVWDWLLEYWRCELPDVEIVIGHDRGSRLRGSRGREPFSKSTAVNNAFARSTGDVVVILDADTYISGDVIRRSAKRIRAARKVGVPMWFVPYRTIYRLTKDASNLVLGSPPCTPRRFPSPPPDWAVESTAGTSFGHKYGALIQIMPREAFEAVGRMDPRFRGWGGEDVCFLRALDTLWAHHKNLPGDVLHLWHPNFYIGGVPQSADWKVKVWPGQTEPGANDRLSVRYDRATNKPVQMRLLCSEWRARSFWRRIL